MAEKRSVYLAAPALDLVRRGDSLSGRLNQVCSRYAELLRLEGETVRAMFSAAEWLAVVDACASLEGDLAAPGVIARAAPHVPVLARMRPADVLVLAELIEAEL